jgi:hypothetical protein
MRLEMTVIGYITSAYSQSRSHLLYTLLHLGCDSIQHVLVVLTTNVVYYRDIIVSSVLVLPY